MKKWLIVYSSVTGNTKQIAEVIYDGFGEDMANIFAIRDEFNLEDYDNIAVGYLQKSPHFSVLAELFVRSMQ